jgi:hypothetical protein
MRRTSRLLRLLPTILAVWCLGCETFERIPESLIGSHVPERADAVGEVSTPTDACDCALGHAAVISVATTAHWPSPAPVDFVDGPPAAVLPPPEPLLRPPVA